MMNQKLQKLIIFIKIYQTIFKLYKYKNINKF